MSIDMESDFRPTQGATAEDRIAEALEYIAYQLGQINRKFNRWSPGSKPASEPTDAGGRFV